jgi:SH3 domain protein
LLYLAEETNIGRNVVIASKEVAVLILDSKAQKKIPTEKRYIRQQSVRWILATLLVLFHAGAALAGTMMFISPQNVDVPIRRGASEKYKIIKIASISDQVELLEEKEGWSRVRFHDKDKTEGWLPSHLLTSDIPAAKQLKSLLEQHGELKRKNDDLSIELADLQEHQNSESTKLSTCIAELNTAKAERRAVEDTTKVAWFLAGSGVLLVGWLLGRMSGRPSKRKSGLSFR